MKQSVSQLVHRARSLVVDPIEEVPPPSVTEAAQSVHVAAVSVVGCAEPCSVLQYVGQDSFEQCQSFSEYTKQLSSVLHAVQQQQSSSSRAAANRRSLGVASCNRLSSKMMSKVRKFLLNKRRAVAMDPSVL